MQQPYSTAKFSIKYGGMILLSLLSYVSLSQSPPEDQRITFGRVENIDSKLMNEKMNVWIHVPEAGVSAAKRYPVIYLLDGGGHFYSVAGMLHQLSSVNGNTITPEMIVVAINNNDRTRDLTPTHVPVMFGDSNFVRTSGGLQKFMDFIEKELMPYVEKNYPTLPYRTFIGHSFGGLAVAHTLLTRPELFNNYVALDPSLFWDNDLITRLAAKSLSEKNYKGKTLYVAVANTLPGKMTFASSLNDTSDYTMQVRSIMKFIDIAEKKKDLRLKWKYYENEDHGAVPLISQYDAFRFIFPWYSVDRNKLNDYFDPAIKSNKEEFIDFISNHFNVISSNFGYTVLPEEAFMNGLGYQLMQVGKNDLAFSAFDINIKNYPESYNVYDSMGDYYSASGNKQKAIESYTASLKIKEVSYTRDKLQKLQAN